MTLREHRNTNMSDDLETAPLLTTYTDDISRDEKELEESLDSNDPGVELAVVCEQPVHTAIVSSSGATQNAERNAALHGIGCMVIDPAGVEDPSSMGGARVGTYELHFMYVCAQAMCECIHILTLFRTQI
jgi:hypothetical protein